MSDACSTHGSDDKQIQNFGQINQKGGFLENLSVVWKVVLKRVFKKMVGNIWTLNKMVHWQALVNNSRFP